ncbi:MAG: class I SAM-dependent methyltransferase [Tepidiformaceae bacterium]
MGDTNEAVEQHYSGERLAERIIEAARAAGIEPLTATAIAPADEFHTGGLRSTRELAELADFRPGISVLDIGSGLGGPSRVLAAEFGCRVTALDLTPEFVRSGRLLSAKCGLEARVTHVQGDALDLPFPDAHFDAAWTQHVVMNIRDRASLYRETARVLKPGGTFAFFDILKGTAAELDYPLPWADDASISFLYTADETRAFLNEAGFEEVAWVDATEQYLPMLSVQTTGQAASELSLRIVLGDGLGPKLANTVGAVRDGRLIFVRALFRKPA